MLDEKYIFTPPHWGNCETGKFPPEKPRYTMTEEVENTAREMRNTIDRLLRFEERLKTQFDDMMKNITSDNVIFKNTFADSHRTFLEAVKNEINVFEANMDASVTLFKNDLESNYAGLAEEVRTKVNDNLVSYVEKLNAYKTELNATYDALRSFLEKRLSEHNTDWQATHTDFVTLVNRKIATLEVSISDAITYMKTELALTIASELDRMKNNGELENIVNEELEVHVKNDFYNVNVSSDLSAAVTYCKNNAKIFYVPYGRTITINGQLDLTGVDVDIRGTVQMTHNGIGLIVGDTTLKTRNIYIREVLAPNYKEGDISVRVVGVKRARVTIDYAPTIQLYANGDVTGQDSIAYSVFNVLSCRKLDLYDEPDTVKQGWINENTFNVERVTEALTITGNTYQHNNNVFNKPCLEGAYLKLYNCRRNKFYNVRNEGMKGLLLDSDTWQNVIIYNYHTEMMYNRGGNFTDDGRDNIVESEGWQNNRYVPVVCLTPKALEKGVYDTGGDDYVSGDKLTPPASYARAIDIEIPAKYVNRIRATSDTGSIQIRIKLLDADGNAITTPNKCGGQNYTHPAFYYGTADSRLVYDDDGFLNPQTGAVAQTVDILTTEAERINVRVVCTTTASFKYLTLLVGCNERDSANLEYLKYTLLA